MTGPIKVLWLKFGELLPLDTGGKLRSFHLLRELSRRVDLAFVSYSMAPVTPGYCEEIRSVLPGSEVLEVQDIPEWRKVGLKPMLLSAFRGLPLNVSRFASSRARHQVAELIARRGFDIGICDFLTPTCVFPAAPEFPAVLFEHNVEWALWNRRMATIPWGPRKLLYRWETSRTRAIERNSLNRFDATLAVSEGDRRGLLALAPDANIEVLPTGVDVTSFAEPAGNVRKEGLVVFLGSMDWQPNVDGVRWFVANVWPTVLAAAPAARFRIVGRRPHPEVLALASETIEVTGDVPAVQPHLHGATLTVVPLRAGGGTRLKIFESMAAGAPVVSTTVGAEGLAIHPGMHLEVADEPESFARAVVLVLTDRARREALRERGLAMAREQDWSTVAERLDGFLRRIIDRKVGST